MGYCCPWTSFVLKQTIWLAKPYVFKFQVFQIWILKFPKNHEYIANFGARPKILKNALKTSNLISKNLKFRFLTSKLYFLWHFFDISTSKNRFSLEKNTQISKWHLAPHEFKLRPVGRALYGARPWAVTLPSPWFLWSTHHLRSTNFE